MGTGSAAAVDQPAVPRSQVLPCAERGRATRTRPARSRRLLRIHTSGRKRGPAGPARVRETPDQATPAPQRSQWTPGAAGPPVPAPFSRSRGDRRLCSPPTHPHQPAEGRRLASPAGTHRELPFQKKTGTAREAESGRAPASPAGDRARLRGPARRKIPRGDTLACWVSPGDAFGCTGGTRWPWRGLRRGHPGLLGVPWRRLRFTGGTRRPWRGLRRGHPGLLGVPS